MYILKHSPRESAETLHCSTQDTALTPKPHVLLCLAFLLELDIHDVSGSRCYRHCQEPV